MAASLAVAGALPVLSCTRSGVPGAPRRYELSGRVVSVDTSTGLVTVAHKAIPGFMDAMTMELASRPPSSTATLTPGDRIRATLVVSGGDSWIEGIERLEGADVEFQVDDARDPEIGSEVPAFKLTDQNGTRFGLERFRGRAVFVSFIYTRCPLPDYCARMTANFEALVKATESLTSDPSRACAFLSISIDPEHDTPAVLREYAAAQAPSAGGFERWTFATGTSDEVRGVARSFGLSYETAGGQIVHSLRTVLIAPDGRVAAILRGNTWTQDDAIRALEGTVKRG